MGGMVAQEIVAMDAAAGCGLVLACTSPAFGKPEGGWQQSFLRDRLAPLDAGLGMPVLSDRLVAGMVGPNASPQAVASGCSVMGQVPEATYRQALQAIISFDRREDLSRIRVPTLCLAAEFDKTAPPLVMERMSQRIPGSQFCSVARAGHLANVEQPQAFAQAVIHFLHAHFPRTT
jgi:pimeloyl-ACP methyl ester carboxylesterase